MTTTQNPGPRRRQEIIDAAEHSGKMEGFDVDMATKADAGDYVAGRITSAELVEKARRRYGIGS